MLFLRPDCALQMERATVSLQEQLVIRYHLYNGLSPMEVADGRIEHLDAVEHVLFMPRRHWKRNCVCDIDAETVRLQTIYAGGRKKGPLLPTRYGGHYSTQGIRKIVKRVARRTDIPGKERISAVVLKRTFAREWIRPRRIRSIQCPDCGFEISVDLQVVVGSLGSLQKQFSHKHLKTTAHYLRFVLEDIDEDHQRLMQKFRSNQPAQEVTVKHGDQC